MRDKKSNEIADKLREIGNFQFKKGDYHEALVAYNRSLCHALPDTEQFSFAFANRSAVYLKVKLFEKCLQNIELARKHGYPEEKQSKLNEREETCKKLIETFKDEIVETRKDFFKLSYEANKKIPFIVKSLEVREDDKYGRYITTSSNLKPGDIIAIDEPIYKYINSELCHRRCTNCLKSNHLSLIPCLSCSNAMYCCVECKDEHDKLLHLFECGQEPLHESVALTVKMILTALTLTGSIQNLQRILNDSKCQTVFDLDLSKPQDESYKLNILLAINALTTVRETEHTKSVSLEEMFEKHPFDLFLKTDVEREFMRSFTNKQLKILDTNLYDMKEHSYFKSSNRTHGHSIGSGLCVFASLFSHSCDPSVKRITVDNKIAFVVVQPIQANEQIFVSYGYSSYEMPREIRQLHLESYGFLCDCVACQKHYPLLSKQPRRISYYNEPNHNAMTALAAICELKKACKFIENIFDRHPCYETTDMMIYCDHLLHQISKLPLEEYALSKAKKH